uniref:ATP synthase F0 subunit 8 n=1 Tax=Pilsbryoconcha exilis TaxID=178825 RepID=A0A513X0H1_9BIVA|nr:ATP synthase F0 subunit 8 [Pilsbryoconcha exilis]QDH07427.1 ATP synthase F0 subunit 8 [Pilsbryoconcha exilis]
MPQLSPMSWVMVIFFFVVCWVFLAGVFWWGASSEYRIGVGKEVGSLAISGKKWWFGAGLKLGK